MGNRHALITSLCVALMMLILMIPFTASAAGTNDSKIQQLFINKPEVTVYYRDGASDFDVEAYLDGEKLTYQSNAVFSDLGKGIDYYLLVDISGSIRDFESITDAIVEFRRSLRDNDRMLLFTFGDAVTMVLDGSEKSKNAEEIIKGLSAHDSTTLLAEAVKTVANQMDTGDDPDAAIQTLTIISDGKPDTDHSASVDNAKDTLIQKGIQTYTIAVENNEGDDKNEIDQYRSRFNDIADAAGGLPYTVDGDNIGESVLKGFKNEQSDLFQSNVVSFTASTNIVSNKTEEFVLKFLSTGKVDTRNILVDQHLADNTAPEILEVRKGGDRSMIVTYSEDVEGADKPENYEVQADGRAVSVNHIKQSDRQYELVLDDPLINADYTIHASGITDHSEEKNVLDSDVKINIYDIALRTETIKANESENGFIVNFSEAVKGADDAEHYSVRVDGVEQVIQDLKVSPDAVSVEMILKKHLRNCDYEISFHDIADAKTGKNKISSAAQTISLVNITEPTAFDTIREFVKTWWPWVLSGTVLLILCIILVFAGRLKKKKITVIDGEVVQSANLDSKFHVGMEQPEQGIPIRIWISNGKNAPKEVKQTLRGSMCIGRSSKECDVYCDDPMMSKQHFILSMEKDGNMYITDLESTNGTSVNGVQVKSRWRLMPGDEVSAGSLRFHFEWDNS